MYWLEMSCVYRALKLSSNKQNKYYYILQQLNETYLGTKHVHGVNRHHHMEAVVNKASTKSNASQFNLTR